MLPLNVGKFCTYHRKLESTTVTENILVLQKNIHFIKVLSRSRHLLQKNNTFNAAIIFAYCSHFIVLRSLMLHPLNVNFALCWKWCKHEIMKLFFKHIVLVQVSRFSFYRRWLVGGLTGLDDSIVYYLGSGHSCAHLLVLFLF